MRRTGSSSIESVIFNTGQRKKHHSSWLIAWLSGGILLGTFMSFYWSDFASIEWLVCSVCFSFIGFTNKQIFAVFLIFVAGITFGLWRGSIELQSQYGYEQYFDSEVTVIGRVGEDPSIDSDGDVKLKLVDIAINGTSIGGKIWVITGDNIVIKRSDIVTAKGLLVNGFGTSPAAMYRARISAVERQDYIDVGRDTRDSFAKGIRTSIQEPEASLGAGFLLGQKTSLPEKLENDLRLLGLTHIIVASGYNLTILIRFSRRFLERISRFTALAGSFALIYGFLQLTGSSPSMARASLIAGISLFAWYFGRKLHPIVLLSFSAACTVIINPSYAWGDIGWLLSFMSFVGVIIFAPLIHAFFWGNTKASSVRQVFIETISAQLLTLPIIAYVFGQYSPLSLPANMLVLSLIPLAMILTAIAGIAGLTSSITLAGIVGFPAKVILLYITSVVNFLSQLPLASAEIVFTMTTVIVCYVAIILGIIFMWRRTDYKFRNYNVIE